MQVKKPTIKIVNPSNFLVECRWCAGQWSPFLRSGGRICWGWIDVPVVRPEAPESEECVTVLRNLTAYLRWQEPGRLQDTSELERHLAGSWATFEGNHVEDMTTWKLLGRMERVEWSPPVLSFVIERYGRTCAGSTRADLHRWTINLIERTATCEKVGHRQLRPMEHRLSIQPLAEEIAERIIQGQGDERLDWRGAATVRVILSAIFPSASDFKQTVEGHRKRFMQAAIALLEASGWRHVGHCMFAKEAIIGA